MISPELDNLLRIGKLKREPPTDDEIAGLLRLGRERLRDAVRGDLAYASRFDLAYNAAHALALVALRRVGYRSENRYVVFQSLVHTTKLPAEQMRVLAKAHERRNSAEYEGHLERDDRLLAELIAIASAILRMVEPASGADAP